MAFNVNNPIGTGTDAELLVLVRAAIVAILQFGQNYMIRGRNYTRADLGELRRLEAELTTRVSTAASVPGGRNNYGVRRPPV